LLDPKSIASDIGSFSICKIRPREQLKTDAGTLQDGGEGSILMEHNERNDAVFRKTTDEFERREMAAANTISDKREADSHHVRTDQSCWRI
jgi:hypothetical protein